MLRNEKQFLIITENECDCILSINKPEAVFNEAMWEMCELISISFRCLLSPRSTADA